MSRFGLLLIAWVSVLGCESTDLLDLEPRLPEITSCEGQYVDLVGGEITYVSHPCAEGAVCTMPKDFGACADAPEGGPRRVRWLPLFNTGVWDPSVAWLEGQRAVNPRWPFCTRDDDCANGVCVFEPGCATPRGLCCSGPPVACLVDSILEERARRAGVFTYCGCDDLSFEGIPRRPYAHPGACR